MPLLPPVTSAIFPSSLGIEGPPFVQWRLAQPLSGAARGAAFCQGLTRAYMRLHRRTCTFVKNLSRTENSMKTVNSLPPPEVCNCFAVRAAARHVTQSYDQFLAPSGLRTTQYSILTRLKRKGPLTINAL